MDIFAFLGRFHPVVVHLPIGFLVIAILLELYDRRSKSDRFDSAVSVVLFWGGMSSLVAIAFGWMLAAEGTYSGDSLEWHRWPDRIRIMAVENKAITTYAEQLPYEPGAPWPDAPVRRPLWR
jgi:hypothetical protein